MFRLGLVADNDIPFILFFLIRRPTSGMLSYSLLVTTDKPCFRSKIIVKSWGAAQCLASSAFSLASLDRKQSEVVE